MGAPLPAWRVFLMRIPTNARVPLAWIGAALAAISLAGCREPDSITTVETPRSEPRAEPVDVEKLRETLDYMLAAIVPAGEKAWFFKLVVPGSAIEELRKPFDQFIASVELGEDEAPPTWTLPEGWQQSPASEMRAATIEIPHDGATLELAVSSLPFRGKLAPYVEMNVNRWLGQLQQAELPGETIAKMTRQAPVKGGEATVVELAGDMDRQASAMPAGHPPVDSAPRGERPETQAGTPPAEVAMPKEFTYEAPAGWQPGKINSMRKAAFNVVDGDQQAEVTVMPFPASGAMGDPVAQAQRWAGQVGLASQTEADLDKNKTTVTIDGVEGQQFDLFGPGAAGGPRGILAAMIRRGELMWFFKMDGDQALVEKQREAFGQFIESIEFVE